MKRRVRRVLPGLLAWALLASPQRPSDAEAAALIETSHQKALGYTRSLPDFECTEVILRSAALPAVLRSASRNMPAMAQTVNWVPSDQLTVKLSDYQQREIHKLLLIDGRPTGQTYESLTGAIQGGEFGGTLRNIFDPAARATFRWEKWKTVQKRRAAVYSYVVAAAYSNYLLGTSDTRQAIVGFHGEVELDRESGEVLHLTYQADITTRDLGLDFAPTTVDYDFADIGGQKYLLPAHSETEMRSPRQWARNDTEFREYRKFSSESVITYGVAK